MKIRARWGILSGRAAQHWFEELQRLVPTN